MTVLASTVSALGEALERLGANALRTSGDRALEAAVFSGCGDSLSAALLATNHGHRVVSSGDLAWYGGGVQQSQCLVALSYSGATAATLHAAVQARESGWPTVAITPDAQSPLAKVCGRHVAVPRLDLVETVPAAGYVSLSLGTLLACGADLHGAPGFIAEVLEKLVGPATHAVEALPPRPCQGVSVITLPDFRSSGDFWVLKFIEATGLAARSVPLEECGHVDYFIGPQPHLTVQLIGSEGRERHATLGAALRTNGHLVLSLDIGAARAMARDGVRPRRSANALAAVAVGALGASVAHELSVRWGRTPFRGGQVDMSAAHIQVARPEIRSDRPGNEPE